MTVRECGRARRTVTRPGSGGSWEPMAFEAKYTQQQRDAIVHAYDRRGSDPRDGWSNSLGRASFGHAAAVSSMRSRSRKTRSGRWPRSTAQASRPRALTAPGAPRNGRHGTSAASIGECDRRADDRPGEQTSRGTKPRGHSSARASAARTRGAAGAARTPDPGARREGQRTPTRRRDARWTRRSPARGSPCRDVAGRGAALVPQRAWAPGSTR